VRRVLSYDRSTLLLDGVPHQMISGSLCYFRMMPDQWSDRLTKLAALGANAVEVYVPWNFHELRPGEWDFSGAADLTGFIRLAGDAGLNVVLRPGPYICAEWSMGGLPWWLLANEPVPRLRTSDPVFWAAAEAFIRRIAQEVRPLLGINGGPILAVQIENEYGYWSCDTKYLELLRDLIRETIGPEAMLFTVDGCFTQETQKLGGLDGVLHTASFGSSAESRFRMLRETQTEGPLMCMEFWVGWFSTWGGGAKIERSASSVASELAQMLAMGASVNLFVFHGGTSFGFMAGANLDAASGRLEPHVTSYDYDAILTESGELTPKYHSCRDVILRHLGRSQALPASISAPPAVLAPRAVRITQHVGLLEALPVLTTCTKVDVRPVPIEFLGEGTGYGFYRFVGTSSSSSSGAGTSNGSSGAAAKALEALAGLPLKLPGALDFALLLTDGRRLGTLDRQEMSASRIELPRNPPAHSLEVIVEVTARVNFGPGLAERKGLSGRVAAGLRPQDERELVGWESRALPMHAEQLAKLPWRDLNGCLPEGPAFYRGFFELSADEEPADTYLLVPSSSRGFVALNGFNLGWHRREGPQLSLYAPASLLRRGRNEVIVFELLGQDSQVAPAVSLEARPKWSRNRAKLAAHQVREVVSSIRQVGPRQLCRLAAHELSGRCVGRLAVGCLALACLVAGAVYLARRFGGSATEMVCGANRAI